MQKIIFATKNAGKIREINEMLSGGSVAIISMLEAGLDIEIEETGETFAENAMLKAEAVMLASGLPAIADDSGLEVDFLDKAPGVYSARYMGETTPYSAKNAHIISLLENAPDDKRTARFVCAMAAALPDGRRFASLGVIEGEIAREPMGENGFGYDPIFFLPELGKTTAQLMPEQKNKISHRGLALADMLRKLADGGIL